MSKKVANKDGTVSCMGWTAPADYRSPNVPPKPGSVRELIHLIAKDLALTVDGKPKQ